MPLARISKMLIWIRSKRVAASLLERALPLSTVLLSIVALHATTPAMVPTQFLPLIFAIIMLVCIIQTCSAYTEKTHDPAFVWTLQSNWDSADGYARRRLAAKTLRECQGHLTEITANEATLANIDDALDLIEDVGFYVFGDQISPEAARHHFFYWIQGYWFCARDYIEAVRKHDPTRWENIRPLFEVTASIERAKKDFSAEDRAKFIREEEFTGLANSRENEQPEA
jgi:hypothetical protein